MKIYTKFGDQGKTALFGGKVVPKSDLRIQAYGDLDEVNACLGAALTAGNLPGELNHWLLTIQNELFHLGAELATPDERDQKIYKISLGEIERLEKSIDQMEVELEPLTNFILPGGGQGAAFLHLARTVTRRSERSVVRLAEIAPIRAEVIQYINRLSDFLFVAARFSNQKTGIPDQQWKKL